MQSKNLTQGSIFGNIVAFSLPYMLAYLLQILYGLADLFIIGQFCDVAETTATTNGVQVMHFLTVVIIGLVMGSTVQLARSVGANDNERASRIVGNTITLFSIIAVILAVVMLIATDFIIAALAVPQEAVNSTRHYLVISFIGVPFIVFYNLIASIFRGLGDSKRPMYFVIVACVINVALDYLFIGGMGMGAAGAAIATILAQLVSVIVAFVYIRRNGSILNISRATLRLRRACVSAIMKVGVPVALQDGFVQVAFLAITVIANSRGLNDAAAVGIVEKFIGLLFVVPSAMLSTVSAISAQNIGAGKWDRARQTLRQSIYITAGFGLVAAVVFQFVPELAVRIFTNDETVIALGGQYLKGYAWDCVMAGLHFCYSGFFTACGYSIVSFVHNVISIVCARVPLSYLASINYPDTLYPMGLAIPIGSAVSVVICVAVYYWMLRRRMLGN